MKRVVISRRARADLRQIAAFIATDDPKRAISFVAALRSRCLSLARHPLQGRPVPDIAPNVRIPVFRPYLILHRVRDDDVLIDRVVHTARDRASPWPYE